MNDLHELQRALFAIGEAARNAERRGAALADHSISPEELIAVRHALALFGSFPRLGTAALLSAEPSR